MMSLLNKKWHRTIVEYPNYVFNLIKLILDSVQHDTVLSNWVSCRTILLRELQNNVKLLGLFLTHSTEFWVF
jgi:hypothetical protein